MKLKTVKKGLIMAQVVIGVAKWIYSKEQKC